MKLNELLKYDDIVIQCHDNPDADALASGYGVYWYLEKMGKNPKFIYRGNNEIQKSNLLMMISALEVPVDYAPNFYEKPELLVVVDCQYGQSNVTKTEAGTVAVIDHHQVIEELTELSEIRSTVGSCATVVWDMIRSEGLQVNEDKLLSTALYYGLYTDTARLSEMNHPLDRDMIEVLDVSMSIITEMSNSNISLEELKITGRAILDYDYYSKNRCLIIHAEKCDPNILGVISDFSMETSGVDVCVAFYISPEELKFSVRSCVREVHANELAACLADKIGGGGGHLKKAGGAVYPDKLESIGVSYDFKSINDLFVRRIEEYYDKYEIIYAKDAELDISTMKKYEKQPQELGYVKLTDVFPLNTMVEIRTLEGDVSLRLDDDKYLMIGIEGEVYPITKEKLEKSYIPTGKPYSRNFEYEPSIRNLFTDEKKNVMSVAHGVISSGRTRIYAKPLDRYIKLFTTWNDEKYYSGAPGDYIAVREDDIHDIYIINGRFFDQLYKEIDS
ncbi:MAG: DHH family phosphoesterase [Eubacterium sp.]|nr:DHH family phosphoesterase [Eubacterium sp.]